ncbi:hypothetical protein SLEP1_g58487 [Rubroshorea leprosula]|uniref:Uncharacterized protein n=1 Tax=Rubroshorea leprosula TaxID=152421 RepID=A0AAV5MS83_9ROSI|nr:hypothetical protein SLEP1_g58487 [Rubroshorea leprosula]
MPFRVSAHLFLRCNSREKKNGNPAPAFEKPVESFKFLILSCSITRFRSLETFSRCWNFQICSAPPLHRRLLLLCGGANCFDF